MTKKNKDFVSIITVNYNGKKFLGDFLDSAFALDYPKDKYEVIVVDNASVDGSISFVKKNYPEAKIVESKKNLGFGGGNNLGIKKARGDLYFLVNNDTVLTKDSLKEIVTCFNKWSKKGKVGAVNAKLVLMDSYLPLEIRGASFSDYGFSDGFKPINKSAFVVPEGWTNKDIEEIFVPINYKAKDNLKFFLDLEFSKSVDYEIYLRKKLLVKGKFVKSQRSKRLILNIDSNFLLKSKLDLIQNAGNFIFRRGFSRDRGACVILHKQYYEPDLGQYNQEEIVPGFNGAGVLLNKKALDEVGLFNRQFFMYYEDVDLSLTLKEMGWKVVYCPKAKIRHIHAASSKEWSPFFVFNAERNRLIFVARHWPRWIAIKEWTDYFLKDTLAVFVYNLSRGNREEVFEKLLLRLKINISLALPFLGSLLRTKRLAYKDIKKML